MEFLYRRGPPPAEWAMERLETPRLWLRRLNMGDLPHIIALETDPEVARFSPSRLPRTPEDIEQRLKSWVEKADIFAPFGMWAALEKDGAFVGWFMLLDTRKDFPELGFMLLQQQRGKGFATEAAARLLQHGWEDLGLPAIMAATDQDNVLSKRVLAKIGFEFSKTISHMDRVLGREVLLDVFEIRRP